MNIFLFSSNNIILIYNHNSILYSIKTQTFEYINISTYNYFFWFVRGIYHLILSSEKWKNVCATKV